MNVHEYSKESAKLDGRDAWYDGKRDMWGYTQMRLLHAALGLTGEAGELADAVKKHVFGGKPLDVANVLEEAGDVLWYLDLALRAAGLTMADAMAANIAKLQARYPDSREKYGSRDREAEAAAMKAAIGGGE